MRYLNKIIFINSAKIKYTEVSIDGNVHFTGTQGVGKSTILRALLFFYNAHPSKLGIADRQKSFLDFYLENANSYVVYEVIRETGTFCIFIFRSQGRVSFRFFDGNFQKKYFIDSEGMAYESSEKIRTALGNTINLSKKIDSYEEYRNILYGNHQAIEAAFRKYAIIESKQFQNIPRTIQNVFLNSKLDAEFIKETIIKSLNEEEISINLNTHSNHLKDFKTELGDIEKWTEKNKNREVIVRKQAQNVIDIHSKIRNIELDKLQIAKQIGFSLNQIKIQKPKKVELLEIEAGKKQKLDNDLKDFDSKFQKQNQETAAKIGILESDLKKAKNKQKDYVEINIETIIERVSKKADYEIEEKSLLEEKVLLTSKFQELEQKYFALLQQTDNQLNGFKNLKDAEKNKENGNLQNFKEALNKQFEVIFEEISQSYKDQIETASEVLENTNRNITSLKVRQAGAKNERFFEKEIIDFTNEINEYKKSSENAESDSKQRNAQILLTQQSWALEKTNFEEAEKRQNLQFKEQIKAVETQISEIRFKIDNSKDSFYGWLNDNYKGWENTIGKVIDENILFKFGLLPQKTIGHITSFYGVEINLDEISKKVKTVTDYENEITEFQSQIEKVKKKITESSEELVINLENLRKKYQPKINENKKEIEQNTYLQGQNQVKIDQTHVKLNEIVVKAKNDKDVLLKNIEDDLVKADASKSDAEVILNGLKSKQSIAIEEKKNDKSKKAGVEQQRIEVLIKKIDEEILQKQTETEVRKKDINVQRNKELANEGAETERLTTIETKLKSVEIELKFIEENNAKVIEYNKDKRELFDNVDDYKRQKERLETKQANAQTKYIGDSQKLQEKIGVIKEIIENLKKDLSNIEEDLSEYEKFKTLEGFEGIESLIHTYKTDNKSEKRCKELINEFQGRYYASIKEYQELQVAINKFNSNFSPQNLFKFKINLIEKAEYFKFADELQEFIDEDKINTFQKRVNDRFASIIKKIANETGNLLSKENEIAKTINDINNDFVNRNFAGVIKSIQLKTEPSSNKVVQLLIEIKKFNDENIDQLGEQNLFSQQNRDSINQKAVEYLALLDKAISNFKKEEIRLSDSFDLLFRIKENDNDTNWVSSLASVGSDGTDVLVKAMINIMLLNVFKDKATKNKSQDFKLHCMMDEIGKLHSSNVKGILQFANDRNIILINSSPESLNTLAYKYTYHLSKDNRSVTTIKPIIINRRETL